MAQAAPSRSVYPSGSLLICYLINPTCTHSELDGYDFHARRERAALNFQLLQPATRPRDLPLSSLRTYQIYNSTRLCAQMDRGLDRQRHTILPPYAILSHTRQKGFSWASREVDNPRSVVSEIYQETLTFHKLSLVSATKAYPTYLLRIIDFDF
jgi:hypothetical protein